MNISKLTTITELLWLKQDLVNESPLLMSSSLLLHSSTCGDLLEHSGVQEVKILYGLDSQLQLMIPTGLLGRDIFLTQPSLPFYTKHRLICRWWNSSNLRSSTNVEMSQKESLPPRPRNCSFPLKTHGILWLQNETNYRVKTIFEKDVSVKVQ